MNLLRDVPLRNANGDYNVIVEVPRGNTVKLKYDAKLNLFVWSRALPLGVEFPHDYGFLPNTLAEDNDAVDALVLTDVASYPGVVVPSRIIGSLRIEQKRSGQSVKRNDRVLAVPVNEHRRDDLQNINDLSERTKDELQAFFLASLALTGKKITFRGWADAEETIELIDAAAAMMRASS